MTKAQAPNLVEKETRFAVVMYGGISLAIYIHGAAQELYHMARATARIEDDDTEGYRCPDEKQLDGTEKIYRRLGEALKTKFVVDILSGTSAGGLNAVFLAKALARGKKMEFVKNFWVKEGDIAALLNDAQSLKGLSGLSLQTPSLGLLNSQRFYYKILEALMQYESEGNADLDSAYAREIDLNITATDIRGLNLPLFVANNSRIVEPRYKNVFQFYYRPKTDYAETRNDFTPDNDPFLAFAARCTASIPPAFEAMQLKDIEPILKTAKFNRHYGHLKSDEESWRRFYRDYVNEGDDFPVRSFGDGGYLDNKPFSYATEALLRRRADLPVDRKLIYIEPSPVHAEDKPYPSGKPDMIENISAALSLPKEETIREDLKVIEDRNRIVGEMDQLLRNVFSFGRIPKMSKRVERWRHSLEWARKFPMEEDVQRWYGTGYYAYHQLRVASVADNLARAFSRALGWVEQGESEEQMKRALRIWAGQRYGISPKDGKFSQHDILFRLDMSFRIRRFQFLQNLLNAFLRDLGKDSSDRQTEGILRGADVGEPLRLLGAEDVFLGKWLLLDLKKGINHSYARAHSSAVKMRTWNLACLSDCPPELKKYAARLRMLKKIMDDQPSDAGLADAIERTTLTLGTHPFVSAAGSAEVNKKPSGYIYETFKEISGDALELGIRFDRRDGAKKPNLISDGEFREKLDAAALQFKLPEKIKTNSSQFKRLQGWYRQAQRCLAYYHDNFEHYDMLTFPIAYGTDAGESDIVEVVRISPEDGVRIVNEARDGRRKLAGTQLMNFGAFFKQGWRENDMLWGRLDTAEILIAEMLRGADQTAVRQFEDSMMEYYKDKLGKAFEHGDDPEARRGLIYDMAFLEILEEDLCVADRSFLYKMLNSGEEDALPPFPPAPQRDEEVTLAEALYQLRNKSPKALRGMFDPLTRLAKNINRQNALQRIKEQVARTLRAELGAGPSPLRKQVYDALDAERRRLKAEREDTETTLELKARRRKEFNRAESAGQGKLFSWLKRGALRRDAGGTLGRLRKSAPLAFSRIVRAEDSERILEYFRLGYETDPNFEPQPTVQAANRGILVLGDMLKGLSEKYPLGKKPAGFLLVAGRVLTAAANFAVPKTTAEFVFNSYWVWLIYLAAFLLLLGANYLGGAGGETQKALSNLAVSILLIMGGFHSIVSLMHDWFARHGRRIWLFYPVEILIVLAGVLSNLEPLARVGFLSLAISAAFHVSTSLFLGAGDKFSNTLIKMALKVAVSLVPLAFITLLVYGGLQYLEIIEGAPIFDSIKGYVEWMWKWGKVWDWARELVSLAK